MRQARFWLPRSAKVCEATTMGGFIEETVSRRRSIEQCMYVAQICSSSIAAIGSAVDEPAQMY